MEKLKLIVNAKNNTIFLYIIDLQKQSYLLKEE